MIRLLFIATLLLLFGCTKDQAIKEMSYYPDCFEGLTSSHTVGGCGSIFLTVRLDTNKLVSISLDEQDLGINTKCKTFNVADLQSDIRIHYYTHGNHPDSMYFNFCSDVVYPEEYFGTKTTWTAVSGTVKVVVSSAMAFRDNCERFETSVELENIRFIKENSTQDTTISQLIIRDKSVGFCIP